MHRQNLYYLHGFFPEGGYLVDGIKSTVAFKVVDSKGMPAAITGIIKIDGGVNLSPFASYHDGTGTVLLKPQYGKKYKAEIYYNGEPYTFELPAVQETGINLHVENEKTGKLFMLYRTEKGKENFEKVRLVVQSNNHLIYENEINFEDYLSVKGHIVTDNLPSGILHFTVFSAAGLPLLERLAFVDNNEYLSNTEIKIEKKNIEPRAENIIKVIFPASVQRSCAVAITTTEEDNEKENIISSLLLTSDIKGSIFNPNWYFQNHGDSTAHALDNLLLTQGWSRFSWKKILAGDFPKPNLPKDQYLITLSGFLKNSKTKESVSGGLLSLYFESEDSVNQNFDLPVDVSGKFSIDSLLLKGKTKLFYGYTSEKGKETPVNIYIDPLITDSIVKTINSNITINEGPEDEKSIPAEIDIRKRYSTGKSELEGVKVLDAVTVKTTSNKRPIDEVNEKYATGVFSTLGSVNIDNINKPSTDKSISAFDFIKRSINTITVQDNNFVNLKNFSLMGNSGKWLVAVFLDQSPSSTTFLKTIRMDEVALIKFYEPGFVGAGSGDGPGGALAVFTKKNEAAPAGQIDRLDHIDYEGYALVKEFYVPDYTVAAKNTTQKEDNRTTLYWNADILNGSQAKEIEVKFFNSDIGKKIKVVVEGFDVQGKLIHAETILSK